MIEGVGSLSAHEAYVFWPSGRLRLIPFKIIKGLGFRVQGLRFRVSCIMTH